jgi:hypothetical protein
MGLLETTILHSQIENPANRLDDKGSLGEIRRLRSAPRQRNWCRPAGRRENLGKLCSFVIEKQPTSIVIGWSEPVSGRELHPLKSSLSRRTVSPIDMSVWKCQILGDAHS